MRVQATLSELPGSPPCELPHRIVEVTALYRVEKVLQGTLEQDSRLLVVHRCPALPRQHRRLGKGEAGPMRPGQVHLLTLRPVKPKKGAVDRFAREAQRYRAVVTDPGPKKPRIVVVLSGGAGARQRLEFHTTMVTVGRSYGADVLVGDPAVAPWHLRLVVDGDKISVRPWSHARLVRINGKRIERATHITYKDRIQVGTYVLRAALFLPPRPEA